MAYYINKSALVAEILKRRERNKKNKLNLAAAFEDNYLLSFLDTLEMKEEQKEPVSEELEKVAQEYVTKEGYLAGLHYNSMVRAFKAGAKWYASHNTKQPDNLLLAARKASIAMCDYDEKYLDEYPYDSIAEQKFIEGANWQKEQLKAKDLAKDVNFEKEWKEYFKYRGDVATVNIKHLAKHFFELGMSVSNKTQKGEQQ